jgi:hypothetical protein
LSLTIFLNDLEYLIELKGEKFIDIRFEENQFVLRFGFETDKKSAMKLQEFIKEKCVA